MKESSLLGVVFVKIVISGFRLKNLANLNLKFSKKSTRLRIILLRFFRVAYEASYGLS